MTDRPAPHRRPRRFRSPKTPEAPRLAKVVAGWAIKLFRQGSARPSRTANHAQKQWNTSSKPTSCAIQLDAFHGSAAARLSAKCWPALRTVPSRRRRRFDSPLIENTTSAKSKLVAKQTPGRSGPEGSRGRQRSATKDPKRAIEMLKERREPRSSPRACRPKIAANCCAASTANWPDLDKYIIDKQKRSWSSTAANRESAQGTSNAARENKIEVDDQTRQADRRIQHADGSGPLFPEAEVLAKRARELDPENPVVRQIFWKPAASRCAPSASTS